MERFYLTTTLPYVNAEPHIGHALEFVQADAIARWKKLSGCEVFFNTGVDEHGVKVYRKALEAGRDPQEYVDEYAQKFKELISSLGLLPSVHFIRTSDPAHKHAAQEFWKRCRDNGHIYKKNYRVKYCVGCELEKTDSELAHGRCPIHPNLEIEVIDEENYFFRFSAFQNQLLALYDAQPDFVIPDFRFNEIRNFVAGGLEDFSISRLKEKMPWGVPVPDDDTHVMYVWFDALVNYVSAIGWPNEEYAKWWPVVQFAGKDNLRQQSAMWQAMLMGAGIAPSKHIVIHGFITSGGEKMSKSLGNVIHPDELLSMHGTEALRYVLLRHVNTFEDSDLTKEKVTEAYNANLANGLGNLVARIMKMATTHLDRPVVVVPLVYEEVLGGQFAAYMNRYEIGKAIDLLWQKIGELDRYIEVHQPYKTIRTDENKAKSDLVSLVAGLSEVAHLLSPFMPETAQKITQAIESHSMPETLFPRVES